MVEGAVADQIKLVEALKKVAKEQKIESCVLALPEEKAFVYVSTVKIPAELGKNLVAAKQDLKISLRSVVEETIPQNIPLSSKEVVFDFVFVSIDHKNLNAEVVVFVFPLVVASTYTDCLMRAGISAVSFETESQAIARSVAPHDKKGTHAILYFMGYKAVIAIVSDNIVHYASTVTHATGANEPVELVMVKDELSKVISYWHSKSAVATREKSKIQSVIVAGKVDELLDLPDYISKNLQLPSHMADVWQNAFSLNEKVPEISFDKSLVFASASGSALLPLLSLLSPATNLLPQNYQSSQESKYRLRLASVVCGFVFGLSVLSLVFFVPAYVLTNVRANTVSAENKSVLANGPTEENVAGALTALAETSVLATEIKAKLSNSNVFETLRAIESKPGTVKVDEILYTNKSDSDIKITILGVAATRDSLKTFADFLSVLPEFDKIDLPISNFTKESNIDFSLNAVVRRSLETDRSSAPIN